MQHARVLVLLALLCLPRTLAASAPSPPDLALLPIWREGEVWVLRDIIAGAPAVTEILAPSSGLGRIRGVALSPDGNTAVVLHMTDGVIQGGVVTMDGVEIPIDVEFLPDGKAAVIVNAEPVPEEDLTVQVLAGLPNHPYLAGEVPLRDGNGNPLTLQAQPNLAVSPDCRHVGVVARWREVALLRIVPGDPPALVQEGHRELQGLSTLWLSFGPDGDTLLTPTFGAPQPLGPPLHSRLHLFSGILDGRLDLAWSEELPHVAADWAGVAALPDGDTFATSTEGAVSGNRLHFYDGLSDRSPARTDSWDWEVERRGGSVHVMPDGDTLLSRTASSAVGPHYWVVFHGARSSEARAVGRIGPIRSFYPPAVPLYLPQVVADAGPDLLVEAGPECIAHVVLEGRAAFDAACAPEPDERVLAFSWWEGGVLLAEEREAVVELGLGTHELTFRVVDTSQRDWEDTTTVEVVDVTPPVFEVLEAEPSLLWPPDHKMRPVDVRIEVRDNCDAAPAVELLEVSSSEPPDDLGDGHTEPDFDGADLGLDDREVLLRAERDGRGPGRTYTLRYRATDFSGNAAEGGAVVRVPHDMGDEGGP